MEDITIGFDNVDQYKGQPFRVTFKGQDYQVKILDKCPSKNDTEYKILLDGIVQKIIINDGKWQFEDNNEDSNFAHEIWRSISLRYRI